MKTLKSVLEQDYSKKTKSELIEMLSGLEDVLSPSVYEQISGIDPSELQGLTKKEIIDIIDNFKTGYDQKWESSVARASSDALKLIFGQMAEDDKIFITSDAASADFAAELGSIDFATIIGGPLDACVKAQSNASISTVSFINEVGFETDTSGTKKLRMAEFKYKKNVPNPEYDPANPGTTSPTIQQDSEINVPFIALLNVPSFRIESCEVDFNVKLNSTYTKNVSSEFGINAGASGGWGPVKFKVDVSYKRSSSTGIKVEKEYSLGVKVRATNDEMPAGLEKVLGLLGSTN
ncbi:DUF2589 domain-containing protein [Proteiniphilum sp. UBA7639]|jgi:hypothetical protein|uniref:DUF2589 domain-containing protein n=2 Tax=root TaxID=1 RepID=A0A644YC35_9ZZZZ|nr:DUF2589 domain-containing protein [Proteiniphilum sp. UBA7639]MDD2312671.1 DUF2589 domain-containing protein [Petrimonas sp.]MDD4536715.1 DUF2589 domain-containing protein [Petrimonas sp.]MEA5070448.1 DUF2589 domain-containing protein [Petrimonas sp.]HOI78873.1 DUF2589 domain-containing protein [Petrimonas sp.]